MGTKIEPYDIRVPQTKENNFFEKGMVLIRQIKFLIILQSFLGLNRLYLLQTNTAIMRLFYVYSSILFTLTLSFLVVSDYSEKTYVVFKESTSTEYLILIITTAFTYKDTLHDFFKDLSTFDDVLDITKASASTIKGRKAIFWIACSLAYCVAEGVIFHIIFDFDFNLSTVIVYFTTLAHDSEQIFFVTLIRTVMVRVRLLRAHIAKSFNTIKDTEVNEDVDAIEELSERVQLDTTAMHRAYELLHNCADELNAVMSFPMIVMLFTSGLSTTMLLKKFFQITQDSEQERDSTFNAILTYTLVRCIKYTIMVVIPCYYATVTSRIVVNIRTMLHNAINTYRDDKFERRRIKAFFHLTQDNEFSYALWGVIRLSMSLPLSYASLCTTYLVIIIQFSKFID